MVATFPLAGPTGATGAAGTAPFTNVRDLSGTPNSVTDWGALINTAIAAGTRHFIFQGYDFPITTKIDCSQIQGIVFEGASGWDWYEPGRTDGNSKETGHARLIWKGGASSGYAIDFSSASTGPNGNTGPVLKDLMLVWDNTAYDGSLIKYQNSTMGVIERCFFGRKASVGSGAPASALHLDGVNTLDIKNSTFDEHFLSAIRGRESGGLGYSNVVRFHECTFNGGTNAAITNPGLDWVLDHCIFEFSSHAASKPMITTDFTYGAGDQVDIVLNACEWWDASGGTQTAVTAPAGNSWTFTARNCTDHNVVGGLSKLYDFQGTGNIIIDGGSTLNKVDVGSGSTSTARKKFVRIVGFDIDNASSTTDRLLNVNTGHYNVEVSNLSVVGPNKVGVSGQAHHVTHEIISRVDVPAIAAHSGVTGHSFYLEGDDTHGFIVIRNTSGSTGPTGLIADLTLAAPPASVSVAQAGSTHKSIPIPLIGPARPDDGGNLYVTPDASAYWTCQPYAQSKAVGATGAQNLWQLGVNVGIPNNGTLGVAYRLAHS